MKEYKILNKNHTMIIIDRLTGEEIAEYPVDNRKEIAQMRRTIDRHLRAGGKLGNYQW